MVHAPTSAFSSSQILNDGTSHAGKSVDSTINYFMIYDLKGLLSFTKSPNLCGFANIANSS